MLSATFVWQKQDMRYVCTERLNKQSFFISNREFFLLFPHVF